MSEKSLTEKSCISGFLPEWGVWLKQGSILSVLARWKQGGAIVAILAKV